MNKVLECSICLQGINQATTTLCKHVYHAECLSIWLERVNTCPECRSPDPLDKHRFTLLTEAVKNPTDTARIREMLLNQYPLQFCKLTVMHTLVQQLLFNRGSRQEWDVRYHTTLDLLLEAGANPFRGAAQYLRYEGPTLPSDVWVMRRFFPYVQEKATEILAGFVSRPFIFNHFDYEMVFLLTSRGINASWRSPQGRTIIELAKANRHSMLSSQSRKVLKHLQML